MDYGLWIMDYGLWIMDCGLWTIGCGFWNPSIPRRSSEHKRGRLRMKMSMESWSKKRKVEKKMMTMMEMGMPLKKVLLMSLTVKICMTKMEISLEKIMLQKV